MKVTSNWSDKPIRTTKSLIGSVVLELIENELHMGRSENSGQQSILNISLPVYPATEARTPTS
ncbi:hypothetical protein H3V13_00405 [Bartonella sp. M0280]|uniref:hypothetical protein n=1 Tax=Bartonella apihabitans TaxID=2750929 RepID=UPI0018DD960D|nr:hypothetical protein [Bartonella apihabitans]MBI0166423.1 hypothetical protein [Bartonella apihabitans]